VGNALGMAVAILKRTQDEIQRKTVIGEKKQMNLMESDPVM
jgi:hypothetical protein